MKRFKSRFKIIPFLQDHGRAFYASFYFVTALAFIFAGVGFLLAPVVITSVWPGNIPWALSYFVEAGLFTYLGFTTRKEPRGGTVRVRLKQLGIGGTIVLLLARGVLGVIVGVGGPILALVTPVWVAFVMLWAGVFITYLPAEVDEYERLRDRVDSVDSEIKNIKRDNGASR